MLSKQSQSLFSAPSLIEVAHHFLLVWYGVHWPVVIDKKAKLFSPLKHIHSKVYSLSFEMFVDTKDIL